MKIGINEQIRIPQEQMTGQSLLMKVVSLQTDFVNRLFKGH